MTDKMREALFSILGTRVAGARVLDLYCGSGAIAIEALSRGAAAATLVDSAPASMAAARENLERTGFDESAKVVRCKVEDWAGGEHDLVFLDPPYSLTDDELHEVVARLHLAPGALVVAHRPKKPDDPLTLGPLPIVQARKYGQSVLLFAQV